MNSSQTLRPATTLFNGNYRIISVLGRGGFGITYLAENVNLGKRVAIKEFFPSGMYERDGASGYASLGSSDNRELSAKLKAKFLKEARRLASLSHESIVNVSNAFEENGTAYYVMDYIEGKDLRCIVTDSNRPMPLDRALRYINHIGAALEYLHARRINHLDVKPGNILVNASKDRAILIDFGLSKQYDTDDRQTSTTPVGISAGYAPNEQYRPGGVSQFSAPTDVYALGATLYFLLTGATPPTASELGEDPLQFPSDIKIPDYIKAAIRRAMAFRRADRFQTVADFLRALDTASDPAKTVLDVDKTFLPDEDPVEVKIEPAKPKEREMKTPYGQLFFWICVALGAGLILWFALKEGDNANKQADTFTEVPKKAATAPAAEAPAAEATEGEVPAAEAPAAEATEGEVPAAEAPAEADELYEAIHSTPRNLDLCVKLNGRVGYISENDWKQLSSSDKNRVTKEGLYLSGNNEKFLLALRDLQEEEIDWYDAMRKYESRLPNLKQAEVMGANYQSINRVLETYGGQRMDSHNYNYYWTSTTYKDDAAYAWFVSMTSGAVLNLTKYTTTRVRAVAPVPVASAMK